MALHPNLPPEEPTHPSGASEALPIAEALVPTRLASLAKRGALRIRPAARVAGGAPAAWSVVKALFRETGLRRGVRTLLRLNQPGGFDCPGCAWPDPAERSTFEFCENGVKHVAHEATTKRVTPDFFQRWSIPELLQQ